MTDARIEVSPDELVKLCAISTELFGREFFPGAIRQDSPAFHRVIDEAYDNHNIRYLALCLFRDSAKTTKARINSAKRVSYAVTHTGGFVGASATAAERNLRWLKSQVEHNHRWTSFFGLERGSKWSQYEIEIINKPFDVRITFFAAGLLGSIRGVNIGDYRPDYLLLDDIYDDEMVQTKDQREKVEEIVFSSVLKTLAPRSESPNAKLVINQTPLHKNDVISLCERDKQFTTLKYSIFDENGNSRWESRWPTPELKADKQAHIDRNQLLLWLREKEVILGDAETAVFRGDWLQYYDILPTNLPCVISIDPVPPPSDRAIQQDLRGKDWEVIHVWGLYQGQYYLLARDSNRGHEPDWTIARLFEFVRRFRPLRVAIDGTAYQRTLKWILEKAQREQRLYFQVVAIDDKRSKAHKITQSLSGIGSQKRLHCHSTDAAFIEQFSTYPNTDHDDELDAAWMAINELSKFDRVTDGGLRDENDYKTPLKLARNIP